MVTVNSLEPCRSFVQSLCDVQEKSAGNNLEWLSCFLPLAHPFQDNYLNQTGHLKFKKAFEGNSLRLCAACEEGQLQITAQSSCVKNSLVVKAFVILVLTQFAISWSLFQSFFNYRYLLKDSRPLSISHLHTWKLQILTTV